jgi:monoterpene epsilon-lactone hydrolase
MSQATLPAWQRWISLRAYGVFASTLFRVHTPPEVMRARFERFARVSRGSLLRKHPQLVFEDHRLGKLELESVCAVRDPRCVVIHLHGGAFVFGSIATYRNRAMRLSYRLGAEVFVPEYRLAPEHPYPAALEDALATYQYVRALRPLAPIIITGDSAGGGLALSLLVRLRERGERLPDGAILLSPWTDLAVTTPPAAGTADPDLNQGRERDRWLSRAHLERWGRYYAGSTELSAPLLSPVYAELHGLPSMLVLAGEHEVLLDDALRVVERACSAGTDARMLIGRGMQHDWPLTLPWLDESKEAWRAMAAFVAEQRTEV